MPRHKKIKHRGESGNLTPAQLGNLLGQGVGGFIHHNYQWISEAERKRAYLANRSELIDRAKTPGKDNGGPGRRPAAFWQYEEIEGPRIGFVKMLGQHLHDGLDFREIKVAGSTPGDCPKGYATTSETKLACLRRLNLLMPDELAHFEKTGWPRPWETGQSSPDIDKNIWPADGEPKVIEI